MTRTRTTRTRRTARPARTLLLGGLLAVPLLGLGAGPAAAAPWLPPGAPVPVTGTITIAGSAAKAAPARPAVGRTASRPGVRLAHR